MRERFTIEINVKVVGANAVSKTAHWIPLIFALYVSARHGTGVAFRVLSEQVKSQLQT